MNDLEKTELLDWFLVFINWDMEDLDAGDCLKLLVELGDILSLPFQVLQAQESSSLPDLIVQLYSADIDKWITVQQKLKAIISKVVQSLERIEPMEPKRRKAVSSSGEVPELASYTLEPGKLQITVTPSVMTKANRRTGRNEIVHGVSTTRDPVPMDSRPLKVMIASENVEDAMIYYFLQALDGVRLSDLKKCKECGGWFIRTTKRERLFCTSRCAARMANRTRYQEMKDSSPEQLEEERMKGRVRATRSYRRRAGISSSEEQRKKDEKSKHVEGVENGSSH